MPAGPVNNVAEVFADPQVQRRGLVQEVPDPRLAGGLFRSVKPPAQLHDMLGQALRRGRAPLNRQLMLHRRFVELSLGLRIRTARSCGCSRGVV